MLTHLPAVTCRGLMACELAFCGACHRSGQNQRVHVAMLGPLEVRADPDAAAGGCAHGAASPAYRPPPRLKEYIAARDLTCRSPRCRQPAWRGDLDHTIPFDDGGRTCRCNLGGLCRLHHILKHHPDWDLRQTAPGIFTWTTHAGRAFTATPDTHY